MMWFVYLAGLGTIPLVGFAALCAIVLHDIHSDASKKRDEVQA